MRNKLILNDVHLGVHRSAGTTPKTAAALKKWLLSELEAFMMQHLDKDIIFNGDVFDEFDVPLADVFAFFEICQRWLEASHTHCILDDEADPKLAFSEGNHDLSKNSANMCSLAFLAKALNDERVILIEQSALFPEDRILVIPHVANQDMFNLELEKAAEFSETLILVHANYDNNFAVQSDHSLNISAEQAKALTANNNTLLFGHVHQYAKPMKNVIVAGNQWPSSIADCLGNDNKKAFIFNPNIGSLDSIETWNREGNFAEIDWEVLSEAADYPFVRVVGKCPTDRAADMLSIISRYRQNAESFVVTNAVSVAGVVDMEDLPANLETAKGFDVLGYLFENLEPEQVTVIKKLMEKNNA
jgi:hypothetical protein